MSKKNTISKLPAAFVIVLLISQIVFSTLVGNANVYANGGRNDECEDADVGSIDPLNDNVATYTASGNTITGVCIKAGSRPFGDGHSDSLGNGTYWDNSCYTVSGVGTSTVTVTRNYSSRVCQAISHIDVYLEDSQDPTDTPTERVEDPTSTPTPTKTVNEPTSTPTSTPTDEPTPTEAQYEPTARPTETQLPETPTPTLSGNIIEDNIFPSVTPTTQPTTAPTAVPTVTPTAAPTATPTQQPTNAPTATPTPTQSQGSTGGSSNPSSGGSSSSSQPSSGGQVLGASTLAGTGTFEDTVFNFILVVGIAALGISAQRYVQKNS